MKNKSKIIAGIACLIIVLIAAPFVWIGGPFLWYDGLDQKSFCIKGCRLLSENMREELKPECDLGFMPQYLCESPKTLVAFLPAKSQLMVEIKQLFGYKMALHDLRIIPAGKDHNK